MCLRFLLKSDVAAVPPVIRLEHKQRSSCACSVCRV